MPTKPRLKQGETPQSPAFQKRMREFNRQVALEEANKAKAEQDIREAKEASETVVKPAARSKPKPKSEEEKTGAAKKKSEEKDKDRVAESGRSALENRAKSIEEAIEGGIEEANEENKPRKKKKKDTG